MAKKVELKEKFHLEPFRKETCIAIDPSTGKTGNLGYAIFQKGNLIEAGEIECDYKNEPDFMRLRDIARILHEEFTDMYGLLVVEYMPSVKVKGNLASMPYVIQSAIDTKNYAEISSVTWQFMARDLMDWDKNKHKSDELDAVLIGLCSYLILEGYPSSQKIRTKAGRKKADELIKKLGKKHNWWTIEEIKNKWANTKD